MRLRRAVPGIAIAAAVVAALLVGVAAAAPQPGFDVAPDPATAGNPVRFTAHDPCAEPVTCVWDFGDGSGGASGPSVSHTYDAPGLVTVSLTTDDPNDADLPATETKLLVIAPPLLNRAPEAAVSAAPSRVLTNEVVQFDSSGSSDPDGDALTREWDLDGDGTFETGDVARPFRSYATDGPVTVSLRVTDPAGERDVATVAVTVDNRPPAASIAAEPAAPLSSDPVTFTAVAADDDGSIASYAWDLDGDGGFDDGAERTATATFTVPGPAAVRLRVTDDDGAAATTALEVIVGNRAPTATYSYSPNPVIRGEAVTFTAQPSDPEGRIDRLRWDFGGDGTFEAEGARVTTTFPASRTPFQVDLVVTDQDGGSTVASSTITPGNLSPSATVSVSESTPLSGQRVTFTSRAFDRDGVVSYAWDLDGDGVFDDATGPTASMSFAAAGRNVVRLRVTDDDDASVTVEQEVIVRQRPADDTLPDSGGPGTPGPTPPPSSEGGPPAPVPPRVMAPFPVVRYAGALTRRGARLTLFSVRAPRGGARVAARCLGRGCPRPQALRTSGVKRLPAFQRNYRAGVRIVVRITRRNRIGKYVRITIRRNRPPARRDACLWPGSRVPRACPF
jgi:PKD repeat protein